MINELKKVPLIDIHGLRPGRRRSRFFETRQGFLSGPPLSNSSHRRVPVCRVRNAYVRSGGNRHDALLDNES